MLLFFCIAYQHFGKYTRRVGLIRFSGRQGNGQHFLAFGRNIHDKGQFIGFQITVQVVQLRRDFFIAVHYDGRTHTETGLQVFDF